ncbi:hypothetical protein U0070_002347 [Myodes glareolus]|uniref:Uncharacterized protein n=1 Tax=Myodes glareolus TaxID=447135 RepID=A0AAW0IWU3_MYOGA
MGGDGDPGIKRRLASGRAAYTRAAASPQPSLTGRRASEARARQPEALRLKVTAFKKSFPGSIDSIDSRTCTVILSLSLWLEKHFDQRLPQTENHSIKLRKTGSEKTDTA